MELIYSTTPKKILGMFIDIETNIEKECLLISELIKDTSQEKEIIEKANR